MSANIFFASDTHFGHRNIIGYEAVRSRYTTVEEHDADIVERWNSVVGVNDRVYHLGDVIFSRDFHILAQLNGSIRLVMGNHDAGRLDQLKPHFTKISGVRYMTLAGQQVVLSHVPVHDSQLQQRAKLNLHGHLHSDVVRNYLGRPDERYINCCLEHHNMAPVALEDIL